MADSQILRVGNDAQTTDQRNSSQDIEPDAPIVGDSSDSGHSLLLKKGRRTSKSGESLEKEGSVEEGESSSNKRKHSGAIVLKEQLRNHEGSRSSRMSAIVLKKQLRNHEGSHSSSMKALKRANGGRVVQIVIGERIGAGTQEITLLVPPARDAATCVCLGNPEGTG
ncbi:hypothetical protein ABW20_dc0103992 [Dactylellina cionopaga]|nr:hypothetical protein ABW20_dc0103992 [Dactylellina cionopaga]